MAVKRPNLAELKPWAGLIAGMLAAGGQHQLVSNALHFDCGFADHGLLTGVLALLLIAVGGGVSWRALRAHPDPASSRRLVAQMSLMAAALFALMVIWQTMGTLMLPRCLP